MSAIPGRTNNITSRAELELIKNLKGKYLLGYDFRGWGGGNVRIKYLSFS